MNSQLARFVTEPVVAAVLNGGELWLMYSTGMFAAIHDHPVLHVLVHAHMFLAGYLLTIAIVSVDPMPHRRSYPYRAVVLVAALPLTRSSRITDAYALCLHAR